MDQFWNILTAVLLSSVVWSSPVELSDVEDIQLLENQVNFNTGESDDSLRRDKKSYSDSIGGTVCVQVNNGYDGPVTICKDESSYGSGYSNHAGSYGAGYSNHGGPFGTGYSNYAGPFGAGYLNKAGPFGGGYSNHLGPYGSEIYNHEEAGYLNNAASINYNKGPSYGYGLGHGAGIHSSSYGPLSSGLLSGFNGGFSSPHSAYSKPQGAYPVVHGGNYIAPHKIPHYRSMEMDESFMGGERGWSPLDGARSAYEPYGINGYSGHGLQSPYGVPVIGGFGHGLGSHGSSYHSNCPYSSHHNGFGSNIYQSYGHGAQHYRDSDEVRSDSDQIRKQFFDETKTQESPKSTSAETNNTKKDDDMKQQNP